MNLQVVDADASVELSSYAYSYPHKSSYRPLPAPIPLADAWAAEDTQQLSLYVHIPFCEMRCGFCNLFAHTHPAEELVARYLGTVRRQIKTVRRAVPSAKFSQFAIGGGTPTYLSAPELEQLLTDVERGLDLSIAASPTSVETSPATATRERLAVMSSFGVRRISLGVQAFHSDDLQAFGRPRQIGQVYDALERIREFDFSALNIDLIYGGPTQTAASWLYSLTEALQFHPEELYLYPLYVRPQTGLDRGASPEISQRRDLYRLAVDFLTSHGYSQCSLRCFRRGDDSNAEPTYTCQRDGMVGLGCGARSYTRSLHYATKFAVDQSGIKSILSSWIDQSDQELAHATHGIWLNEAEQRRRYAILSLLQVQGLDVREYARLFRTNVWEDLPELRELLRRGWLDDATPDVVRLTDLGMEFSDIAGPLLYSTAVRRALEEFTRR